MTSHPKRHQTLKVTPAMAAGVSRKFWEVSDKPEYQFIVRQGTGSSR
jgi:hypothetical protein